MTTQMVESCGCVNEVDEATGLMRCVSKCQFHVESLKEDQDERAYYARLGTIVDGIPQCRKYERELVASGVRFDGALGKSELAIEFGCGFSMYVPLIHKLGYQYLGVDHRPLACEWTSSTHSCNTRCCTIEDFDPAGLECDMILAAHVLEHVRDAPVVLKKFHDVLGYLGKLVLIVPNGYDDPTNPDHWWFFTEQSLSGLLTRSGFNNVFTSQRRVIARERFIYASATKDS